MQPSLIRGTEHVQGSLFLCHLPNAFTYFLLLSRHNIRETERRIHDKKEASSVLVLHNDTPWLTEYNSQKKNTSN